MQEFFSFALLIFNLSEANMCLTIPKKVISFRKGEATLMPYNSKKEQKASSIVEIKKGDWVFTQNNIIIEKISKKQADEIIKLINQ